MDTFYCDRCDALWPQDEAWWDVAKDGHIPLCPECGAELARVETDDIEKEAV